MYYLLTAILVKESEHLVEHRLHRAVTDSFQANLPLISSGLFVAVGLSGSWFQNILYQYCITYWFPTEQTGGTNLG